MGTLHQTLKSQLGDFTPKFFVGFLSLAVLFFESNVIRLDILAEPTTRPNAVSWTSDVEQRSLARHAWASKYQTDGDLLNSLTTIQI